MAYRQRRTRIISLADGLHNIADRARQYRQEATLRQRFLQVMGTLNAKGEATKTGYVYHMFLPSGDKAKGDALPETKKLPAGDKRHADAQEVRWCCYAWPEKVSETGKRAFVITQKGQVFETDNSLQRYSGAGGGPKTGNEAFVKGTRNLKGEFANADKGQKAGDGGKWQPVK